MVCTIDSSVWVAAFLKDEKHNETAYNFIASLIESGEDIIIPVTVYIEIMMALSRRGAGELIESTSQFLLTIPSLQFVELTYPRMIDIVETTASLRLRGMDAIVVAVAHEYGSQLATLDRELAERRRRVFTVNRKAIDICLFGGRQWRTGRYLRR